jgi:polar amino acid transport system substrate-binding protein
LESGEPTGFDVDLAEEIAKGLGLKLRIVNNPSFDALIPTLQDGQYDMVVAAMTITPERAQAVDFSEPYYNAKQALVVSAKENPGLTSDGLTRDMIVGVQRNTTSDTYAQKHLADKVGEVRRYDDTPQALQDLTVGRIQAVVADLPVATLAAQKEFKGEVKVTETFDTGERYGIAFAKDNARLRRAVNRELSKMREDGTYDRIYEKWFGKKPA